MKKFKLFKMLAVLIVLITSINTAWAWTAIYFNGNFTGNNWDAATYQINYELEESNSGHYFYPFYNSSTGDKYWRLYAQKDYKNYQLSPSSDNYVQDVGTVGYKVTCYESWKNFNFKTTNAKVGVIAVHINQGDGNGDLTPGAWLERPTIHIWHNWGGNTTNWGDNDGTGQKNMTDNEDGTYTYDGVYSASGTNVGLTGTGPIKKYFADDDAACTKVGSPVSGDKCRFTWDAGGNDDPYSGYNTAADNKGSLTITKILTITYDGNGKEGGTVPDPEEVLYNTAKATYTNTGSMTKTNYAFIGWNTEPDGSGTHYDAGDNITVTENTTLYAEWVPCWILRGGDSDTPDSKSDAMGDWGVQNEFSIIGENAFMLQIDLAASTTYYFKIVDRHNGKKEDTSTYTHYGNNGTMSGTTTDWTFSTSEGNCKLSTGESGAGTWRFAWNASSKCVCVYAPADAAKSSFVSGQYVYFDARTNTAWQENSDFTAKFYFKNLATGADDGDVSCVTANKLDGWVFYAQVPAGKTLGSVQMNSINPSNDAIYYIANRIHARDRSSDTENCMVTPSSGDNNITLTWGRYCPPMSSATLSDHETDKISWQDAGNDGSSSAKAILVSTSKTIEVSGAATKALPDANMTINYDFKVDGSSAQAGNNETYSKGSLANNTLYTITMDAYNSYSGTTGTALTASQTLYYKALNTYTITNSLTNMTSDGREGTDALAYNIAYTATLSANTGYSRPTTITVKRGETTLTGGGTHYTYNSSTGALSINADQVTGNITIIAAGVPETLTLTGSYWHLATSWSPNCVPTIEHDVIIPKICWLHNNDAKAKSVKIHNYDDGETEGRLVIEEGGGLVVATGITAKHSAEGAYEATTDKDLWIRTEFNRNSGLICGNASSVTKATYVFASRVYRYGSYYINQYIGSPFASMSPYQLYGVYVFEYDDEHDAWKTPEDGEDMKTFTAYDIISKSSSFTYSKFYLDGELNLPGTSGTKVLECGSRYSKSAKFDDKTTNGDYMFANSWTAPISVQHLEAEDVDGLLQEIHIFNAGYIPEAGDEGELPKDIGDNPGQWSCITFGASSYTADSVIPAMQAFCVTATKANAKMTLDYEKHVYNPALSSGINNSGTRAPRRKDMEEKPNILRIKVLRDSVMADNMYVFEREDFTFDYDDGWDGSKLFGISQVPQIYGIQGSGKTSINAIPDIEGTQIGFKAGTDAASYTLAFEYNDDEPLYLIDKESLEITKISNDATYSFTTSDTEEHERFVLSRSNSPAIYTSFEEIETEPVKRAEKFFENNTLFIRRGDRVYDATGALVK